MQISYPKNVIKIAKILRSHGYKAYAVGGCMRDAIMGRVPNDWDMTTDCSPEKMLEIFDSENIKTIPTGLKHGTVSILLDGEIFECTTFRIDGSYTDSRHPDGVTFTSNITEDLRRRDFTCNAIAGDPLTEGRIVDVFGGREDIEAKMIRAVGDPEKRFTEDALRILRAVRFATVLDFAIDTETLAAAKDLGSRLLNIAVERKSVELQKILLSSNADRGIELLLETGLAKYVHPEIGSPKVPLSTLPESFSTRLAALFKDVPDLSRMKLSNEITKQTKILCDDAFYEESKTKFVADDAKARYMLSKYGEIAADAALLRGERSLAKTIVIEKAKNPAVAIKDLSVSGNDLLSAGIEAKKLGKIISSLLLSVIEDPTINEKTHLTTIALSLADRKE